MATIDIVDLRVRTIIGTHPWERKNKQELTINLSFDYDSQKASRSDNLKDAVDYEQIAKIVIKLSEESKCFLIEKLADKIITKLKSFKGLQKISLRIDKPQALAEARMVSYKICA